MFISLLIPACYVQWKKFSGGGRLNPVMGFATVFFGFTLTTVSEKWQKPHIMSSLSITSLPCRIAHSRSFEQYERFCIILPE